MVQLVYRAPKNIAPESTAQQRREVMHGYTMGDIHNAAMIAVSTKQYLAADRQDLYQAAWDGVVDLLVDLDYRPREYDLVRAAQHGIQRLRDEFVHHHGYDRVHGSGAAPNFNKYWSHSALWTSAVEESVVENVACEQILAALPANQRRALEARASSRSQQQAADLSGLTYSYLGQLVRDGRKTFIALWHEGETPAVKAKTYAQQRDRYNVACGTPAGYKKHRYNRQQACDDCRVAMTAYASERRRSRRERAAVKAATEST